MTLRTSGAKLKKGMTSSHDCRQRKSEAVKALSTGRDAAVRTIRQGPGGRHGGDWQGCGAGGRDRDRSSKGDHPADLPGGISGDLWHRAAHRTAAWPPTHKTPCPAHHV